MQRVSWWQCWLDFCYHASYCRTANAGKILTSAPLPGGSAGLICACTNLTKKSIDITMEIKTVNGGSTSSLEIIPAFWMRQIKYSTTTANGICMGKKQNRRFITTKEIACSFFSEDSTTGRLMVPVDKKLRQ